MDQAKNSTERIRVNISMTVATHRRLKALADADGTSVSQYISSMVWGQPDVTEKMKADRKWVDLLTADTIDQLFQYSEEHHTTPNQAVTDWIWKQKVNKLNIRGQMSMFS